MVDMATGWLCHELYMWHDTGEFGRRIPASGRVFRWRMLATIIFRNAQRHLTGSSPAP
jgi:hypothetical protein